MPFVFLDPRPFRFHHRSHRAASGSGRGTEGRKIVCTEEKLCGLCKHITVYRGPYSPSKTLSDGIAHRLAKQLVLITTGDGIKTRMERCLYHPCLLNSHIKGQSSV